MGISCSCIERDHEDCAVKPILMQPEVDANAEHPKQCKQSNRPSSLDDELKAKINAIVNAKKAASSGIPDGDLQHQINAIVNSGVERRKPSPVACSPSPDSELQAHINAIVGAHAVSLKQQRLSCTSASAPSPSPAKSVSDMELAYYANLAVLQAKERSTPVQSPSAFYVPWMHCEESLGDIAPCQLSFADSLDASFADSLEVEKGGLSTILVEPDCAVSCVVETKEEQVDDPKVQSCPFDVSDIPSPTRNRAQKQQVLWEQVANSEEGTSHCFMLDEVQQTSIRSGIEDAPLNGTHEKTEQKFVEEDKEAARVKEIREARLLQEMEAMDKTCVDTFLESVKKCAWRERVRTPIKGSNLYTKHIRPCRPAGTSVDVKDSSFRNLGIFLEFLQAEGLVRLKPGLTDPVVNEINFDACRKYRYRPQAGGFKAAPTRQWQ